VHVVIVGYSRVSTEFQQNAPQEMALKQAGAEKIFIETASGAQRDRPELQKALEFLRAGDCLIVWKLDRLGRSLRQLIDTVEDLNRRGIEFRSITENLETTTSGGKLIFHVFGALAEWERSLIRERTMAGLLAAKAAGKVGGRPRALSDADVAAARALLADPAITVKAVAQRLGVSLPTLYRYLPNAREQAAG
jgi:DNA invertase Pin-like site-specific DNA recombinase